MLACRLLLAAVGVPGEASLGPVMHGLGVGPGPASEAGLPVVGIPWHELLRRTFGSEIVCPDCWGNLKLIALVKTETTIRTILASVHLPTGPPKDGPSRPSPGEEEESEWGEGRREEESLE